MKKHLLLFGCLLFNMIFIATAVAQTTQIRAGYLFDAESGEFLRNQYILVEGNRIKEVSSTKPGQKTDVVIDLSGYWVMPGFIDTHVHLEMESSPTSYLNRFQKSQADVALDAALHAKKTLMAGITTLSDLGGTGVNTFLARAIKI